MTVMLETETADTSVYSNYDEVLFMNQTDMFEYLVFLTDVCVCPHDSDLHGWTGCRDDDGCLCIARWIDIREENPGDYEEDYELYFMFDDFPPRNWE